MKITMDMSSYEIEQAMLEMDYAEEIISNGWNPAVDQVCEQLLQMPVEERKADTPDLAMLGSIDDLSAEVEEIFLRKMYSYQQ